MSLALSSLATAAPVPREADALAAANSRANLGALTVTQPAVVTRLEQTSTGPLSWLFGRDGALTAQDAAGAWWAGCSVPAAAARAMLKTLNGSSTVACFLRPPSAAAVRVALDTLHANQAVLALVSDLRAARVLLHCDNFAADIRANRLWLTAGDDWESQLTALLRDHDGLPIPSQFIRLSDGTEELAEAMIAPAQRIFSDVTHQRAAAIGKLIESSASPSSSGAARTCVVAPTHFRLWDDAGHALAQLAGDLGATHVDPDDPAQASPLAMARAAQGCSAVITPNTARADLPNVVAPSTPWVTWLTSPRIPAFAAAGPRDVLLVADPAWRGSAAAAGWPAERVHLAAWPAAAASRTAAPANGPLLICADLPPLDAPKDVVEMSSHRLLWEAIVEELARDPFALGPSVLDYLHARMKRLGIASGAIDPRRFVDGLIAPAHARGLAELLNRHGLPLGLAGQGWGRIETLAALATGPVAARDGFQEAIAGAAALVHVWPTPCDHPISHAGRPVVRATRGRESFLRDARAALAGRPADAAPSTPPLTADLLARIIAHPR